MYFFGMYNTSKGIGSIAVQDWERSLEQKFGLSDRLSP